LEHQLMQKFLLVPIFTSTMDITNEKVGRLVVVRIGTSVSEERVAFLFRVEISCSRWITFRRYMSPSSGPLVRMDAACSSKTSVYSCKKTRCQNGNITKWNSLLLWNPNVHHRIHKVATLDFFSIYLIDSTSSQCVSTMIHVNIILPYTAVSPKWSFPFRLSDDIC
jgi:hypothetical protein